MICIRDGCVKVAVREGRCTGHQREAWQGSSWRTNRPQGWTRTRKLVLLRSRGICAICGTPGATQVDHRIPLSRGGSHDIENLRAVHKDCHHKKTQEEAHGR